MSSELTLSPELCWYVTPPGSYGASTLHQHTTAPPLRRLDYWHLFKTSRPPNQWDQSNKITTAGPKKESQIQLVDLLLLGIKVLSMELSGGIFFYLKLVWLMSYLFLFMKVK